MASAATPNEDSNHRPGARGAAESESSWDPNVDGTEGSDDSSGSSSDDESSCTAFIGEASDTGDIYEKYQRKAATMIYRDYHKFLGKKIPIATGKKPGAAKKKKGPPGATGKGKGKGKAGGSGSGKSNKPKKPRLGKCLWDSD